MAILLKFMDVLGIMGAQHAHSASREKYTVD
jgi:hypothetical protein